MVECGNVTVGSAVRQIPLELSVFSPFYCRFSIRSLLKCQCRCSRHSALENDWCLEI